MSSGQKLIKYIAISFAALLTISIVALILNIAVDIFGAFIPDSENESYASSSEEDEGSLEQVFLDVENLDIESSIYKIRIVQQAGIEGVKVTLDDIPSSYEVYYKKGSKTLKTEDDNWVSGFFNRKRSSSSGKINIYVSDKIELDKIEIEMGVGNVDITDVTSEQLSVECGVGVFTCERVKAESADIEGGVGSVTCKDVEFSKLELEGGVGDVSVDGTLTGKTEISAGMGNVDLDINGNKADYNFKVENGLGSIYVDGEKYSDSNFYNNSQSNLLDIEGGIGTIHVDFN